MPPGTSEEEAPRQHAERRAHSEVQGMGLEAKHKA